MSQIDDLFKATLVTFLGHDGNINNLVVEFLQIQTGSASTNPNDLWMLFTTLLGETGSINDRLFNYFESQGLTGSYNDMFLQSLIDGLLIFSAILREDGFLFVREDDSGFIIRE